MRRILVAAFAMLLAGPPPARAEGPAPRSSPDLSAKPPDPDPLLRMLADEPDLRARAESGRDLAYGGGTLVVLGVVAVPVGLVMYLSDSWETEGRPGAKVSRAGPLVVLGGTLSIVGGAVLVNVGLDRREEAVRAYRERHPGAAQRP